MRSEVAQSPGIARNFSLLETSRDPVRKGLQVFLEGRTAEFERQNSAATPLRAVSAAPPRGLPARS